MPLCADSVWRGKDQQQVQPVTHCRKGFILRNVCWCFCNCTALYAIPTKGGKYPVFGIVKV